MTTELHGRARRGLTSRASTLVAVLLLTVAACGGDDDGDSDEPATTPPAGSTAPDETTAPGATTAPGESPGTSAAGTAEGSITVWAMGTEGEMLGQLADDFMAEQDRIDVEVTAVPWDAAHDRLVNAIAGGEVPDISMVGTTWMGEFATLGGLAETPADIDPEQFFAGAWDTTVVDGVSYGVPWYVETRLIYYRTDLAEEGGVTEPPATWDDLTKLAEAAKAGGAEWGITLTTPGATGMWQMFLPFFWQAGGELYDGSAFTIDGPACVDSLTYFSSFFENDLAQRTMSDVPTEAQFADGTTGAFISGPWMIGVVDEAGADPETYTVAHQPTKDASSTAATSFVGGSNLGVFAQSDNQEAAWEFVRYLLRPEVQVTWYETVSDLPSVQAAWDDPTLADDELLAAFGEQLEDAKAPPPIATWEELASSIDAELERIAAGDTTPEDGCAAMQSAAESIGTGL